MQVSEVNTTDATIEQELREFLKGSNQDTVNDQLVSQFETHMGLHEGALLSKTALINEIGQQWLDEQLVIENEKVTVELDDRVVHAREMESLKEEMEELRRVVKEVRAENLRLNLLEKEAVDQFGKFKAENERLRAQIPKTVVAVEETSISVKGGNQVAVKIVEDATQLLCSVCFEDVDLQSGFTRLCCGHCFHVCCFANSVNAQEHELQPKCPNCRAVEQGEWLDFRERRGPSDEGFEDTFSALNLLEGAPDEHEVMQLVRRLVMGGAQAGYPVAEEELSDDDRDYTDEEEEDPHHHCSVCNSCIFSDIQAHEHYTDAHPNACVECFFNTGFSRSFDSRAQLMMHKSHEHHGSHFLCPHCPEFGVDEWVQLENHWTAKHSDSSCWICFSVLNKVVSFQTEEEKSSHACG